VCAVDVRSVTKAVCCNSADVTGISINEVIVIEVFVQYEEY